MLIHTVYRISINSISGLAKIVISMNHYYINFKAIKISIDLHCYLDKVMSISFHTY